MRIDYKLQNHRKAKKRNIFYNPFLVLFKNCLYTIFHKQTHPHTHTCTHKTLTYMSFSWKNMCPYTIHSIVPSTYSSTGTFLWTTLILMDGMCLTRGVWTATTDLFQWVRVICLHAMTQNTFGLYSNISLI